MKTIRLSVSEFLKGIRNEKQKAEAMKALSSDSTDHWTLRYIPYIEPPVYDSLEKYRTCMAWGGKIENARFLRNGMLEIEFQGIFVLSYQNNKFTLYKYVFDTYNTTGNDLISKGQPLTVKDYSDGFRFGSGIKYHGVSFRFIARDLVRDFVDHCAEACFPEASVRLFRQVMEEGCNGYATINSILKPSYRTKLNIISKGGKIKGLPNSINKYNINVGYAIREAKDLLSKDSMAKLYGKANSERLLECFYNSEERFRIYDCMRKYLLVVLGRFLYPNIDLNVVLKYFSICKANGIHPDISIKRERTMLEKLEPYFKKQPQNPLTVAEPFKKLEKMLDYKYHLIQTQEELIYEGCIQRNCVYTYEEDINDGYCGIFTYTENGNRYTIEVLFYNDFYSCPQFLGFANSFSDECLSLKKAFSFELDCINDRIAS